MKVYITSNRYQNLAAKVAAYSFSRFGYETQIINVEDFDKIKSNFKKKYLKKGKIKIFEDDLQSFTFLRFLIPSHFKSKDLILIIDPDIFAIKDPSDLIKEFKQKNHIHCTFLNEKPRTELMLVDPNNIDWNFDEIINKIFNFKLDYNDLFSLNFNSKNKIEKIDNKFNELDKIKDSSVILHTTQRITQPWKLGLKVDFQKNYSIKILLKNYLKKFLFMNHNKKVTSNKYIKHENEDVLNFVNSIFLEAYEKKIINLDEIKDSINQKYISKKFFEDFTKKF